jgi:preprotein translocase subunit YajC
VVGKIVKADDNFVTIASGNSEVIMQRGAVQSLLPPGSIK